MKENDITNQYALVVIVHCIWI